MRLPCDLSDNTEISQVATFFGILLVEAPEDLCLTIDKFIKRHPDTFIRRLTAADIIDTLAGREDNSLPAYECNYYHQLLDLLAGDTGIIKGNEAFKTKLRQLKIYPTNNDLLVSLTDENVYILGAEDLPAIDGDLHLLKLGGDSQSWKPLFDILGVNKLDRATFIKDFIIPNYENTDDNEQLASLTWIRENYDTAFKEIKKCDAQKAKEFKQLIATTPLVLCEHGYLHPIANIYDPKKTLIKDILLDLAPMPDRNFYVKDSEDAKDPEEWQEWIGFFNKLGMLKKLNPQNLLDFIHLLIEKATITGGDSVSESCVKVLTYINDNWRDLKALEYIDERWQDLKNSKDDNEEPKFIDALNKLAWLPVEISPSNLARYPAALSPADRLYAATEVAMWEDGYLIASQRPLLNRALVLQPEVKKALGLDFRSDNWELVVSHLDKLIALWGEGLSNGLSLPENFNRSVQRVYKFLADKSIINQHGASLKEHFDGIPCLWNDTDFLQAKNTFQSDVSYLYPWRIQLQRDRLEIRNLFEVLGQKLTPTIDDYLELVAEIAEAADGQPLGEDDTKCVIELLRQIAHEVDGNPSILGNWNLSLLTEDDYLLDAEDVIIPDAPWRLKGIREMGVISILHPKISTSLARLAQSPSMARNVIEKPQGKFSISADVESIDLCNRWAKNIRSREFQHGLLRLLFHEGIKENPDLTWLTQVSITPATEITTDLYLENEQIASNVSGNFYYNNEQFKFYLRCDLDNQDIMQKRLVNWLVTVVSEDQISDLLSLLSILNVEPNEIEHKLDNSEIIRLDTVPDWENNQTQIIGDSLYSKNHPIPQTEIYTNDWEDSDKDDDSTKLVTPSFNSARELIAKTDYLKLDDKDEKIEVSIRQVNSYEFTSSETYAPVNVETKSTFASASYDPYFHKEKRDEIDKGGIAKVLAYEEQQGRFPEEHPHENPGFDILSRNADGKVIRMIEVKSKGGQWDNVLVSRFQFETALKRKTDFWLYVVERSLDDDNYQIYLIEDPARKVQKIAYTSNWINIAEKAILNRSEPRKSTY